jgi:hypothetical protein
MNHLRAVATLLMVQGVLEILAGIGALITAPGLAARRAGQVPADMILAFTVGLGILLFLCGGLKLVAGFQNRRLRGRTLGHVALLSAIPTVCTGWCAPSGLATMIYGLVIYSRPEVRAAFEAEAARGSRASLLQ